ncbi:hypothetical protein AAFF_G00025680 [Aldrovandia affinis]|uniref:Neutral ceramidase n=1 Tax=Aldrovandia affinis TaxID=143900 RepID=A0AAD7S721_9TELE|nr:hypothetical protein AAFF_G00025680 [Aldrovandia affinis]
MKNVILWSEEDVSLWLTEEGMQEYLESFRHVNGQGLLELDEADFRSLPLSLVTSDGGTLLLEKIETLKMEHHIEAHKNGHANGHAAAAGDGKGKRNGFCKDPVQIPMPELERSPYPVEWGKTAVAFCYAVCCFVFTTVMISVVHERVPSKETDPPLPDKFFDLIDRVEWAFSICEINGMLLVGLWLLQWILLKYRSIVGRRFFFIVGTLYLYRCVTMYITTLPVPGMHFKCAPKLFGDWEAQMRRVLKMIAGGGLGHTVMLTLTYLFIKEYSPKRFWWYHWFCWILSAVGIICILLAHDHYTVDVVVAYYITTRLFWWYHTMANQQVLKETSQSNFFSRVWWYRFFQYLEQNVQGIVPRNYELPFSWRSLHWSQDCPAVEPAMARKAVCCGLSTLEVVLIVLFVLMTGVSVSLITVMAVTWNADSTLEEQNPTLAPTVKPPENPFLVGVGRADCTGPVGEVPLMGYANLEQTAGGIHTRLFSRAFIVDDGSKRVVFVSADIGMVSQRLRLEVMRELQSKYGNLYGQDNVVLSGTHTHSGLAGYFQYTLFMITSKGYIKPSIQVIVEGIVKSIDIAHKNLKPGRIFLNKGELEGSSINRSPHSYLNNPAEERNRYKSNTDKQMVVLKFTDLDGDGLGMLSWFAVHPVSMNYTNRMVSADNLGYASYLFEQEKNIGSLPGEGPFVAAFASSNLGDVSPNTRGPVCVNTGEPCDFVNSSCPIGGARMCVALGPGNDMFESTMIIGDNIYKKAKELYGRAQQEVQGVIHAAHQWVNMTNVVIRLNATHEVKTCKPALGHSFAAGTIDGGGDLNFTQGAVEGDPFWDGIRDTLVGPPSNETKDCHSPKPILFSTGEMTVPLPWHPDIVDVQMITIGTMSGRRIREAVKQELETQGAFANTEVVIAGLCNIYTHYITTYEEYQVQRYEGASTIYGPHTLSAYVQLFRGLARAIAEDKVGELPVGPEPPFVNDDKLFNLMPLVPVDKKPLNTSFGEVLEQVLPEYRREEVVSVTFVSGNPRNSGDMTEKTFITVEKYHNTTQQWNIVHTDASWETRFHWIKGRGAQSNATVEWHIPSSAQPGTYRIRHFGHFKEAQALFTPYEGTSDAFSVS